MYPQARAFLTEEEGEQSLDAMAAAGTLDIAAMRAEARQAALAGPREDVREVRDLDADGVAVRLYRPTTEGALPVFVHLHGGGFVFNDIDVHDAAVRRLANRTGMAAVSVEYRRPPEHPFPAAPDDVDTVLRWLVREGAGLGVDPGRVLLHGDSAGGNLALVAALRNPGLARALVMIYPFLDARCRSASWDEPVGLWGRGEGEWYYAQYAGRPEDYDDPDFSPYEASDEALATLPPTLVVTAGDDPLRDEGEEIAARIAEAGVPVVATRYLGQLHGFWRHVDDFDAAEPLTRQVAGFLAQHC